MRAVTELERIGYRLEPCGEGIKFALTGDSKPDPQTAAKLLERLKGEKAAALRFLCERGVETTFRAAVDRIKAAWVAGSLDHARPDLRASIYAAEDLLETTWARVKQGQANLEDFRLATEKWAALHLQACEEEQARR